MKFQTIDLNVLTNLKPREVLFKMARLVLDTKSCLWLNNLNNKNFEIVSESIRELTDNQTELNNLIDKTNQSFNRKIKIQNEIVVASSVLLLIISAILLYSAL